MSACPLDNGYEVSDLPLDCAECVKDTVGDMLAHTKMDEIMLERLDGELSDGSDGRGISGAVSSYRSM